MHAHLGNREPGKIARIETSARAGPDAQSRFRRARDSRTARTSHRLADVSQTAEFRSDDREPGEFPLHGARVSRRRVFVLRVFPAKGWVGPGENPLGEPGRHGLPEEWLYSLGPLLRCG